MHLTNQEKTSFVTQSDIYYYKVMLFRLKNARATYQQLVNKMFSEYLGKIMNVYIDDMFVKLLRVANHVLNLQ